MVAQAVAMIAGSVPLAAMVRRSGRQDDAFLLLLYICVAAGFAAWFTLPFVDWSPSTETLFGVETSAAG